MYLVQKCLDHSGRMPRPHLKGENQVTFDQSLGLHYDVDCFLREIFQPPITLQKFIGLFTLSYGGNQNQQGGRVPFMWPAVLCSGLAALSCVAGRIFEGILQHLNK